MHLGRCSLGNPYLRGVPVTARESPASYRRELSRLDQGADLRCFPADSGGELLGTLCEVPAPHVPMRRRYSALIPAALTTWPYFARSPLICSVNCSGVPGVAVMPMPASFSTTSGSLSAALSS